jgi:hypothetical protein
METYWGSGGIVPHISNISIRWRRMVSFTPWSLNCRVKAPSTYWIGGWVCTTADLDMVAKRKCAIIVSGKN